MSLSAAFIIRCHYAPDDPRFAWRLKLFQELTLPSIHKQTDQDFDICVRCNPAHDEIFRQLGCKPFHVRKEYADYTLSKSGKRKYFFDFVKWEDCIDLEQYDIQMGLDSDDIISPQYVARIKQECEKVNTSLHIHFQPESYKLKTQKTEPHRRRYSKRKGSMFSVLYYPDKKEYHHCYEMPHGTRSRLASQSVLIPSGYCWLTLHGENESTGRTFTSKELKGVKSWSERGWQ